MFRTCRQHTEFITSIGKVKLMTISEVGLSIYLLRSISSAIPEMLLAPYAVVQLAMIDILLL